MHHAEGEEDLTIKPVVSTLKDSEVLKALNEEIVQKKLEEKRWTTFLQKPKRPVPRPRFGYQGYVEEKEIVEVSVLLSPTYPIRYIYPIHQLHLIEHNFYRTIANIHIFI